MCVRANYGPGPRLSLLGRPGCAKRVIGRVDQLRDHVVLPDFGFAADLSEFGRAPT